MTLPKDVPAVRTARTAVHEWLAGSPPGLVDDARSVVTDAGAQRPTYGRAAAAGWGLRIVDALADSWHIADDASRVWCVLEPDHGDPRAGDDATRAGRESRPVRPRGTAPAPRG